MQPRESFPSVITEDWPFPLTSHCSNLLPVTGHVVLTQQKLKCSDTLFHNLSEKLNSVYSGLNCGCASLLCYSLALAISFVQMRKADWLNSKLKIKESRELSKRTIRWLELMIRCQENHEKCCVGKGEHSHYLNIRHMLYWLPVCSYHR